MQRTHLKWGAFFALAFVAACGDGTGAEYSRALSSYSLARASFEKVGWHKGLAEVSLKGQRRVPTSMISRWQRLKLTGPIDSP